MQTVSRQLLEPPRLRTGPAAAGDSDRPARGGLNPAMTPKPFQISRRSFLRDCTLTAAATGLPLWFVERELAAATPAAGPSGPNDRPGIGLVGRIGRLEQITVFPPAGLHGGPFPSRPVPYGLN